MSTDSWTTREIALAWRTCLGGWKPVSGLTFRDHPAWRLWLGGTWPQMLAAVEGVHAAALTGNLDGILETEARLVAEVKPLTVSLLAGRHFCERFSRVEGDKVWRAWLREFDAGRASGHLAVCVALRAARFHFSSVTAARLLLAVEAYAADLVFESPQFAKLAAEALPGVASSTWKAA